MRAAVACVLLLLGCEGPETATTARPAIYGDDTRTEPAHHPLGSRAASVLALGFGTPLDPMPTLGELINLCPGEAFADQPVLPSCTGVLAGEDRVLTAAHCAHDCASMWLAFDFALDARGQLPPIEDVFRCAEVLAIAEEEDVAVIRLDRAAGRAPIPLRPRGAAMRAGEQVVVIGHPSGLPAKIDGGGRVIEEAHFRLSSDTFAGSSGSAVLDAEGRLAGIVVGGAEDYEDAGGCTRAIVYGEGEGYELAVPIDRLRDMLETRGCSCVTGRSARSVALVVLPFLLCARRKKTTTRCQTARADREGKNVPRHLGHGRDLECTTEHLPAAVRRAGTTLLCTSLRC